MRKLPSILAALALAAMVGAGSASAAILVPNAPAATQVAAAGPAAKVVIIVGATEGTTDSYRQKADSEYDEAIKYTPNVTKVYSPNATWAAVQAAVSGANIVIYHGHGNGWPSPYTYDPNYTTKDGFGLNTTAGNGDSNLKYYGEPSISTLNLAPNAIVLLHNLCYASGNSEPGNPDPTLDVAKQRADNYASAFLRAGASAVLVDGHSSGVSYLRDFFTTNQSLLGLWRSSGNFNGNEFQFSSSRTPGATVAMDPDQPGSGFYRALTGNLNITRSQVLSGGGGGVITPPITDPSKGATFVPLDPARVLDTRYARGLSGQFMTNQPRTFQVAGQAGVPSGAVAVTGNLTVVSPQSAGYLALGPNPSSDPATSTINFPAGDTRANSVFVQLGSGGTLSATFKGTLNKGTHLLFDVTGYFMPNLSGATYKPLTPGRILDTRYSTGLGGPFITGTPRTFGVAGLAGVPAGAVAVSINVTIADPTAAGYLAVTPSPNGNPATSTVNFGAWETKANGAVVPLGPGGTLSAVYIGNAGGSAVHLIVDVTGYFKAGAGGATFVPINPSRLLDSRMGNGLGGPFQVNVPRTVQITDRGSVPSNAVAVSGNLTAVNQTADGYVTLTPTPQADPPTSTINFTVGDILANGVAVPLGSGTLSAVFKTGRPASTQLIFDVTGYFLQP